MHFSKATTQRDGRPVTIQLIRPDDKDRLVADPRAQPGRAGTAQRAMARRIRDLVAVPAGKAPRLDEVRRRTVSRA